MFNTYHTTHPKAEKPMFGQATIAIAALTLVLALILTYIWNVPPNEPTNGRLDMAKGSERNSKHVQPKTKEQAEEAYEKIKQELEQWKSKPNKTPEDKDYIKKLRKKLEQLRKKKDFSGENHSQKHKGH